MTAIQSGVSALMVLTMGAVTAGPERILDVLIGTAVGLSFSQILLTPDPMKVDLDGLRALGFRRLDILRPGLLTGNRAGPARFGEGLAMAAAPLTDALMHGSLRRYRSIPGETVARAIVALAAGDGSGVQIHENDAIRALAD